MECIQIYPISFFPRREVKENRCFGILRGSIFMTDLVIRLKGGRNSVFGPKLGPKAPQIAQTPYLANHWQ